MTLPATYAYTGASGVLPGPPWDAGPAITGEVQLDGAGHGQPTYTGHDAYSYWVADTFTDDQYAELQWAAAPSGAGLDYIELWVRASGNPGTATDGYQAWSDGSSDTAIVKRVSGTDTVLGTANGATFASGDTMRLTAFGTSLVLAKNGTDLLSVSDGSITTGVPAAGGYTAAGALLIDNFQADDVTGGPPPGTHVVTGRGNFSVTSPTWLATSIAGRPNPLSSGAAEPPNWYHVGMLSWGTGNGVMVAYPVTRDLDLVQIPSGMTTVYYEFAVGVTATIVEQSGP